MNLPDRLTQAGQAHHHYEQTTLKGVYDADWPTWYAQYLLEHGLNSCLATPLTLAQLSQFLKDSYQHYQSVGGQQSWADYTANQLIAAGIHND
ncbi:hypothetical protein [Lyngbya confervoides]|uniref:Uncharacterized protein n=1 Tax=Lyngbya confervoides BDU141951 TaxID=1574623 RepID=A0ABD4SXG3_9CYAN|nr:hypothetical protein [Lyngbya confervoides]MCM1981228.1 hypothetical protein [Lyngbya confervoides BDU141951]